MKILAKCALAALFAFAALSVHAKAYQLKSPDGKLEVKIEDGKDLKFSLFADGRALLENCAIALDTDRGLLGKNSTARGAQTVSKNETLKTPFYTKSEVADTYAQLRLDFGKWQLIVRAYNDMMAYRFVTNFGPGDMTVASETFELKFDNDAPAVLQKTDGTRSAFETESTFQKVGDLKNAFASCLPYIVEAEGAKIAVLESDVFNYPSLRVAYSKEKGHPVGWWSQYPKKFELKGNLKTAVEFEEFIAKTKGSREFPWRILYVARDDAELAVNDAVFKLAPAPRIKDTSWIKPGVSVWEWLNSCSLEGVDFPTGINNDTYKYYIDFASKFGAEYFLIDEGWLDGQDALNGRTKVDLKMLSDYAKGKNVKMFVWMFARYMMNENMEKIIMRMKDLGVAGLKIDFIEHDDQIANEFHEKVSELCAKHKMMIDFHGCYRPNGLNRAYPNILNFEAGRGGENNRGHAPTNPTLDLNLLFTRMLTGPFDYTPGAMHTVRNRKEYGIGGTSARPIGTRTQQLAMFVMYFGPLQVMSDSPTEYEKYPDDARFMATVPTVWDDSVALEAKMSEYAVIARRSGQTWYVAGMTGTDKEHEAKIELSKLLPKGAKYEMELFRDTVNTQKTTQDRKREVREVSDDETIKIKICRGSGFAMKLSPKK